ncbi:MULTISPECIES: four helix bundle protein [unclassified Tychonema]|uniref:four helix bundle protein n=1 Tax=unclassified Tychonema TaxID=2642144 RepID=UPI0030DC6170
MVIGYWLVVIGYWLLVVSWLLVVICCAFFGGDVIIVQCYNCKCMVRFQELQFYQLAEQISNEVWLIVQSWDFFAKNTVGQQLVRSVDSIGANIAEGNGRYNYNDNQRFIKIARGSLHETRHWLR